MRTAVAVVTLLISVMLLHLATPHHNTVPGAVSEQAAAPLDISQTETLGPGCSHPGPVEHCSASVDGRLARAAYSRSVDAPTPAVVVLDCGSGAALVGPVHACTARNEYRPSAAVTPTCAALQSFRC